MTKRQLCFNPVCVPSSLSPLHFPCSTVPPPPSPSHSFYSLFLSFSLNDDGNWIWKWATFPQFYEQLCDDTFLCCFIVHVLQMSFYNRVHFVVCFVCKHQHNCLMKESFWQRRKNTLIIFAQCLSLAVFHQIVYCAGRHGYIYTCV